ncbi:MAG: FliA/WhiG family RNA polymerase sigma factor [Alkaliphilus sp.]
MDSLHLWQNFKNKSDKNAKNALIEKHIELVKIIAGRMYSSYGSNVDYDDLVGYGIFGLIDAIEKFDITKNIKFETYAQIRIRGAVVDQLRNLDWVPRSVRQKAKLVENACNKLENKLGRNAFDYEIANEIGITVKEFQNLLLQTSNLNIISLEEKLLDGNNGRFVSTESSLPENVLCNKEIVEILESSIEELPEREKLIIGFYYYDELTYKEIGKILGVSESRISQLHSKAISRLKPKLQL